MPETRYDVVIAGGGMVGASLALCLSQLGGGDLKVLVVESFPMPSAPADGIPQYRPSFDARSTALSYGSQLIFQRLGLWDQLAPHACPIHQVHVSDRGHFGSVSMTAAEQGWPALGCVVENPWLGSVLLGALGQAPGVAVRSPASVSGVSFRQNGVALTVSPAGQAEAMPEPDTLHAELLVIADGANSGLRRQLGIDAAINDYHQTAFIANVATEKHHGGCAYERFTEYGALAMLPLTADQQGHSRSALVWTFARGRADAIAALSDEDFLARLQADFGFRLGRLLKVGERVPFPLMLTQAREQVRRNVVVMGNAAHSLHPVAGQGFNLALRDVASLAEILVSAKQQDAALGALATLERYQAGQAADQWLTTQFSDRLTAVFGNRHPMLSLARNMGLAALDILTPAKSQFVAQTAGMLGVGGGR